MERGREISVGGARDEIGYEDGFGLLLRVNILHQYCRGNEPLHCCESHFHLSFMSEKGVVVLC